MMILAVFRPRNENDGADIKNSIMMLMLVACTIGAIGMFVEAVLALNVNRSAESVKSLADLGLDFPYMQNCIRVLAFIFTIIATITCGLIEKKHSHSWGGGN